MMKRETIQSYRRVVNKMDYSPSTELERQLMDSHLEALDEIDRLKEAARARNREERMERNNREENEAARRRALGY